jgi:hypothetical protein
MLYPNHDTDWTTSSKGNLWRRVNGTLLIVGRNKYGGFWVRAGDAFVKGTFTTELSAMMAATNEVGAVEDADWLAAQ